MTVLAGFKFIETLAVRKMWSVNPWLGVRRHSTLEQIVACHPRPADILDLKFSIIQLDEHDGLVWCRPFLFKRGDSLAR